MVTHLTLEQQVTAQPGDEFIFQSQPGFLGTQYHIQVDLAPPAPQGVIIGVWGPDNPNLGKARNKPGKAFVDRTLPKGVYKITVQGSVGPFQIVVTKNSWFHKVFGEPERSHF